jgi:NlpC/P60 family putative phage cell wall peptidase
MNFQEKVVEEARRWIGTPYRQQASACGVGADCLGLVRGVWRNLLGAEPEAIPPYTDDWAEPAGEEVLMAAALRWLVPKPLNATDDADIVVFRMRNEGIAKHLAITARLNGHPTIIHSYTNHGVVETSLSMPWRNKIVGRFEFPREKK